MATGIGLLTDRPAFGNTGDLYYGLDSGLLYEDSGTAWLIDANIAAHRKVLTETVLRLAAAAAALYNDGNITEYNALLEAIAALSSNGLIVRTSATTAAARTLTAGDGIAVADGDGVAGNPTLSLSISTLTEDISPDETTDYAASYDNSAATHKKVLLARLRAMRLSNDDVSATPTAMEFAAAFPYAIAGQSFHLTDNSIGTDYLVVYKGSAQWTYVAMSVATYAALRAYLGALDDSLFWPCDETSGIYLSPEHGAKAEGRDIVLNGGFDSASNWITDTGNSIAGGVASWDGTQTGVSNLQQNILILQVGRMYKFVFTILNYGAGQFRPFFSGAVGQYVAANGTYTQFLICAGALSIYMQGDADFIGDLDNVSVTEVGIPASSDFPSLELLKDAAFAYFNAAWPAATNWTLAGSGAVHTAGSTTALTQTASIIIGRTYTCVVEVSGRTAGDVTPRAGSTGTGGSAISANGVAAPQTLTCAGSTAFASVPSSDFDGTIVSVSLEPADGLIVWDGGLETWTSATDLTAWSESLAGTSTVNQDTDVRPGTSGTYSVRLDCDSSNSLTQISQLSLKAGSAYLIRFWAKIGTAGKTIATDSGLFAAFAPSTSWTEYTFVGVAALSTFNIKRNSLASASAWIDDIEIIEIDPLSLKVSGATINQSSGNALLDPMIGFDGVGDALIPASAAVLNSYCNPTQGFTVMIPYSFDGGVSKAIMRWRSDVNNYVYILVSSGGVLSVQYVAAGTQSIINLDPVPVGDTHVITMIVDITGDLMTFVHDDQVIGTLTGLGTWVGNFAVSTTVFGANDTAFVVPFDGLLGPFLWQNAVITVAEALARHQLAGVA